MLDRHNLVLDDRHLDLGAGGKIDGGTLGVALRAEEEFCGLLVGGVDGEGGGELAHGMVKLNVVERPGDHAQTRWRTMLAQIIAHARHHHGHLPCDHLREEKKKRPTVHLELIGQVFFFL